MEKHLSSTWKPRLNISRLKIDRTRAMKFTLNFSVTLLLWACSMDVDDNLQSASTRWWRATSSRYLKTYETIKVPEWIQSNCSEFLQFWVWIPYQLSYRGRVDEKRPRIGLHNNYAFFFFLEKPFEIGKISVKMKVNISRLVQVSHLTGRDGGGSFLNR